MLSSLITGIVIFVVGGSISPSHPHQQQQQEKQKIQYNPDLAWQQSQLNSQQTQIDILRMQQSWQQVKPFNAEEWRKKIGIDK